MTTNDAPDLRVAFLQTQIMLEQIVHLRSTDFAEVRARIMANRDVLAAISRNEEAGEAIPCGGCGETESRKRCIGCMHDFGTPESAWVRAYATPPSDHIASPEGEVTQRSVDAALDAEWRANDREYSIREILEEAGLSTPDCENAMRGALKHALNPPEGNEWAIQWDREGPR